MRVALVSAACLALLLAASGSAANRPRIALEGLSPLVVVGSGFAPASTVRVTVVRRTTRLAKTVKVTAAGKVTARWNTTLRIDGCHPGVITAVASDGRRATWKPVRSANCGADRMPVDPGTK